MEYDNKNDLLQLLSGDLATSFDSRILVVGAYEAGVHSFPKTIYQKIVSYLKSVRTEDVIQQKGELPGKTQPDIPNDDILQKLSKKIDEFEDDSFTDHASDQEVIPIPVLDFAGQIVYHATHQTFITSHGIYLVTFDGSKNLNDALGDREDERRITILESGTSNPVVVVVVILRQEEVTTDLPDKIRNLPPSDEMLDKLCLRIGKEWMVLGLELGIEIERLEQIEYDKPKVLREISRQMLYCWRNRDDESTIRELLQALERSSRTSGYRNFRKL